MGRSLRVPDRSVVDLDTPLRLDAAAALAYPCGSVTERDLERAVREGRLIYEEVAGKKFVTLAYLAAMLPGPRVPTAHKNGGFVYLIGYGPYVKIGFTSSDVDRRVSALGTGSPEQIEIFAVLDAPPRVERELHRRFSDYRLRGEWFRREGKLAEWINAGCPSNG